MIKITVVFAAKEKQIDIPLIVEENCTIALAIARSKIIEQCPEIKLSDNRVGIFGQLATPNTIVTAGDRVEIYRPLTIDPKELRRLKARKN